MNDAFVFHPDRRLGLIFHSVVILALVVAGAWGVLQIAQTEVGPIILLFILPILLALGLIPVFVYRAYALYRAAYVLGRDGIQLRWGLRAEDVPMDLVEWVGLAEKADFSIPRPWLHWPGSVIGAQPLLDGRKAEFMASNTRELFLISTPEYVFAISPNAPDEFLKTIRRFAELGTLSPIPARSVYPSLFLAQVWNTKPARYIILSGLILSLILLTWVSILIPARPTIPFGFRPEGAPRDLVPSGQLLLFPIANGIFFLADVLLGLFFFRRSLSLEEPLGSGSLTYQIMAYLLWGSGVLTAALFIVAVFFILRAI